ncbi:MAG: ATP-binding protein [Trueperaceae bacterium]
MSEEREQRILVVNDNEIGRYATVRALQLAGFAVSEGGSGAEALAKAAERPDLILLDVKLPDMDGFEVCRRLKADPDTLLIPVLHLSATFLDAESQVRGLESGADGYLTYPLEPPVLVATIRAHLRARKAEEEVRRLNERLEQRVAKRTAELEASNQELEAFSYSISHDLRAPLRGIDGFSHALLEDYSDRLDEVGRQYLRRIRDGASRMSELIDDLLNLSRMARSALRREQVDLSGLAQSVIDGLRAADPTRKVDVRIEPGVVVEGDRGLLQTALENLLENAWKFSRKHEPALIEFGTRSVDGQTACFVRDNGAGFDMRYSDKLFVAFQRLHMNDAFEGTGIGLAIVNRIIRRHGGRVWAEGDIGKGAAFYFTVPAKG